MYDLYHQTSIEGDFQSNLYIILSIFDLHVPLILLNPFHHKGKLEGNGDSFHLTTSTSSIKHQTIDFSLVTSTASAVSSPDLFSFLLTRPISAAKVECGTHLADVRGEVSSSMRSTCSSERPLVSGTRKYANVSEMQQRPPHMKKTLAPRLASCLAVPTR
jgi:hypothetical protein